MTQAEQSFLTAKAALQTQENLVNTLEKKKSRMATAIDLAKVQAEKAVLDMQRTAIKAPADGVVVTEMVEEGDFVQRGQQLLTFDDTAKAEIRCNLTQSQLNWILNNSPGAAKIETGVDSAAYQFPRTAVTVFESGNPSVTWKGTLERFDGNGLDERTKTIPCRVVVDQPVVEVGPLRKPLLRGTYVKCRIEISADQMVDQGKRFVHFPEIAVQPGGYVWQAKDGKLTRRSVRVVDYAEPVTEADGQQHAVIQLTAESLQVGERVIISPLTLPVEGTEINDVSAAAKPTTAEASLKQTPPSNQGPQSPSPAPPQG